MQQNLRLTVAGFLCAIVALIGLAIGSLAFVTLHATQPAEIRADSSAVVVLVDNRVPAPVEMFFKRETSYDPLGSCPAETRCIFVIPSAQLGTLETFQVSGLSHGETVPDDSPMYIRIPGQVGIAAYRIRAGGSAGAPRVEAHS